MRPNNIKRDGKKDKRDACIEYVYVDIRGEAECGRNHTSQLRYDTIDGYQVQKS